MSAISHGPIVQLRELRPGQQFVVSLSCRISPYLAAHGVLTVADAPAEPGKVATTDGRQLHGACIVELREVSREDAANECGPADAATVPFDTGREHGPEPTGWIREGNAEYLHSYIGVHASREVPA